MNEQGIIYVREGLAFKRGQSGGVQVLRPGANGGSRWIVDYELTSDEWVQIVAGVSAFADGRVAEVVMAMHAASHLHLGRHQ